MGGWWCSFTQTRLKRIYQDFFFPLRNMIFKQIRILVTAEEPILFNSKESHEPNEY